MKLESVTFDEQITIPNQKAGLPGNMSATFSKGKGYDIDYNPTTGLVTIEHSGKSTSVHITKVKQCQEVQPEPGLPKTGVAQQVQKKAS